MEADRRLSDLLIDHGTGRQQPMLAHKPRGEKKHQQLYNDLPSLPQDFLSPLAFSPETLTKIIENPKTPEVP